MNLEIKIIEGNEVIKLLKNKAFILKWKQLASEQVKVTVQQEYPFVSTWYKLYVKKYNPILILGYDNKTELIGLISLAQEKSNLSITHAGAWQAEYHGWLCTRDANPYFVAQVLIVAKKYFNLKKWKWGWLAPNSDIKWLSSHHLKKQGIYIILDKQDSPILDVTDDDKIKSLNNKTTRKKMNRYKRKGNFYIERITSKNRLNDFFDTLEDQCDFRQMAMFGVAPFKEDLNKKNFYFERLNFPKDNHYTVLWSNDTPLAFNFGECDSDTVYLGVMSYNPVESKNSPGSLILIKLIELIKTEGYQYLDLTPGENNYKELYSNSHRTLYRPSIYFNRKEKVIADLKISIKNIFKNGCRAIGLQPERVTSKFINILRISNNSITINVFEKLKLLFYRKETFLYYKYESNDVSTISLKTVDNISINNYSDLLLYNDTNQTLKIKELLINSLEHFKSDDILYTIVINGELACYAWMTTKIKNQNISGKDSCFNLPENSVVFYDFFTDSNSLNEDFISSMMSKMISDCKQKEIGGIFIGTPNNNLLLKKVIQKNGFKQYQKLDKMKFLWIKTIHCQNDSK